MKNQLCFPNSPIGLALCFTVLATTLTAQDLPNIIEARPTTGEILLRFTSPAAFNSRLEISSNLVNWSPLYTFPRSAAIQQHTDTTARYSPFQFYRVVQLTETNAITGDHLVTADGDVVVRPVTHASFVMTWKDKVIYADPDTASYQGLPRPTLVLITDIHSDHLDGPTLTGIGAANADIVVPQAVYDNAQFPAALRPRATILANGATIEIQGLSIEAIPMYNTTPGRTGHTKGRGNGYVLTIGGKRIYISGDTEDIPEMRALRNIDTAFVCMNLPFTMDVNQAASAVREFRPKVVYPYHYSDSNVNTFKQLVGIDVGVEVRLRRWY